MFCQNCGKEIRDNTLFCPYCGTSTKAGTVENHAASGTPGTSGISTAPRQNTMTSTEMGMKWYKWVIWVQLFLTALSSVFMGISLLTGKQIVDVSFIYTLLGTLKVLNVIFGIIYVVLAVMSILVRNQLAHYKTGAPSNYLHLLIILWVVGAVYPIIVSLVTNTFSVFGDILKTIPSIIFFVIYYTLNRTYFRKRESMFCN